MLMGAFLTGFDIFQVFLLPIRHIFRRESTKKFYRLRLMDRGNILSY
jgi:hypothetical protein